MLSSVVLKVLQLSFSLSGGTVGAAGADPGLDAIAVVTGLEAEGATAFFARFPIFLIVLRSCSPLPGLGGSEDMIEVE